MSVQVVELVFGLWSNTAMIAVGKAFLCGVPCCHPAAGQPDDLLMLNVYWLWLIGGVDAWWVMQVVAALEQLLIKEQQEQRQRSTCPSTIIDLRCSSCNSSSKMQPAPPAVEAAGQSSAHPQIASAQCSAAEEAELVPREAWCRCAIS